MAKDIVLGSSARDKLFNGASILADAVKTTLGPGGRNAVIEKQAGSPLVTKDGVTVAREISLEDRFENMGAQMVKEVASKAGDVAGDGTTTATVLAQAIINKGRTLIGLNLNPVEVKRGIDKGVEAVLKFIDANAKAIDTFQEVKQVGTISANGDEEIGTLLAEAMEKVGREGVITVEQAKTVETTLDVEKGLKFDRGYLSPHFITDPEDQEALLENPLIVLSDRKISAVTDILVPLELAHREGRSILFIAEDITGDALNTMVVNKARGTVTCAAVRAPGFGDNRNAILKDLSSLTGAAVLSKDTNTDISSVFKPPPPMTPQMAQDPHTVAAFEKYLKEARKFMGEASSVRVAKNETIVVGKEDYSSLVEERVAQIRAALDAETSEWDKEQLRSRLAKLVGGVGVLHVGAGSETEIKEKMARVDDALNATKAAVEGGVVPGGGVIFIRALKVLDEVDASLTSPDQKAGVDILRTALEEPLRQICKNAGEDPPLILAEIKKNKDFGFGYNAATGQYENLLDTGIVDPAKVSKVALQSAASVASVMLTAETAIVEIPQKNKENGQLQ
jgi:chaperonin GroEL